MDDRFKFEPLHDLSIFIPNVFESQFIKIETSHNKFTIIGNIYRPNTGPIASVKDFNKTEIKVYLYKSAPFIYKQ